MSEDADHEVIDSPQALFRHLYEAHHVQQARDLDPYTAPVQFWIRKHNELEREARLAARDRTAEPRGAGESRGPEPTPAARRATASSQAGGRPRDHAGPDPGPGQRPADTTSRGPGDRGGQAPPTRTGPARPARPQTDRTGRTRPSGGAWAQADHPGEARANSWTRADRRAGTPEDRRAGTPEDRRAGTPEDRRAGTPEDRRAGTPEDRRAPEPEDWWAPAPGEKRARAGVEPFEDPLVEALVMALVGRGHDERRVRGFVRSYVSPDGARTGADGVRAWFVGPVLDAIADRLAAGPDTPAGPAAHPAPGGRAAAPDDVMAIADVLQGQGRRGGGPSRGGRPGQAPAPDDDVMAIADVLQRRRTGQGST